MRCTDDAPVAGHVPPEHGELHEAAEPRNDVEALSDRWGLDSANTLTTLTDLTEPPAPVASM